MLLRLARFFSSMLSQFLKKLVALQGEQDRQDKIWYNTKISGAALCAAQIFARKGERYGDE